ncbi:hypothetical protein HanPSC8_Chr13g0593741 [Helianthus annuus]|nr:hypothetical protein HanPSC8_Chr13g0593741 [Helianthus annuus]
MGESFKGERGRPTPNFSLSGGESGDFRPGRKSQASPLPTSRSVCL